MIKPRERQIHQPSSSETTTAAVTAGCLFSIASALVTSLLLLVNGSIVLAVLKAVANQGPDWADSPPFTQFLLFTVPIVGVILQWIMIDYVRTRFIRSSSISRD